jgi:hypothetical protein
VSRLGKLALLTSLGSLPISLSAAVISSAFYGNRANSVKILLIVSGLNTIPFVMGLLCLALIYPKKPTAASLFIKSYKIAFYIALPIVAFGLSQIVQMFLH